MKSNNYQESSEKKINEMVLTILNIKTYLPVMKTMRYWYFCELTIQRKPRNGPKIYTADKWGVLFQNSGEKKDYSVDSVGTTE